MKRLFAIVGVLYLVTLGLQIRATSASNPVVDGKFIFRYDTFGDEQLWTTKLRLHEAVATLSPNDALDLGLKVDLEALPPAVVEAIKTNDVNTVDLNDPAVTLTLLQLNAVVGVVGKVTNGRLESIGITCALCHS
ncbi:MAG TPA: hypothetical protein VFO19_09570, partial [Vicinamibacterales bacterium]|nr:hypothetical protein [Vicinamibacterales bacterium]